MTFIRAWIVLLASLVTTSVIAADDQAAYFASPSWLGPKHLGAGDWDKLDALVEQLAASGERAEDGRFKLYLLTSGVKDWIGKWNEDQDEDFTRKFARYSSERPDSAFAPIVEAMRVHATAWRARGGGFSSSVTPEGWRLFGERSQAAWQMLQAAKTRSSRLPVWYSESISIGLDADVPRQELAALFIEGIKRFPDTTRSTSTTSGS